MFSSRCSELTHFVNPLEHPNRSSGSAGYWSNDCRRHFLSFFLVGECLAKVEPGAPLFFYCSGHKHLATIFTAPPMTHFGFLVPLCFPYPCLCVGVGVASCQSTPAWLSTIASIQAHPPVHTYLSLPVSPRQFVPPARVLTSLWLLSMELPSASHHAASSQPFSTIQPSVSALWVPNKL